MTTGQVDLPARFKRAGTNVISTRRRKPFSTPDIMSEVAERLKTTLLRPAANLPNPLKPLKANCRPMR